MAGLVFACIAPHGTEVILELAGDAVSRTALTRAAMEELGRRMEAARPDTVIVITPHGVRVAGAVCVMTTERAVGSLIAEDVDKQESIGQRVDVDMAVDTDLANRVAEHAETAHGVPVVTAIYGASGGDGCFTPLDWGAVVPLWFLGARWPEPPRVVSITPSRALSLKQLYNFGIALAEASVETGRRVTLVASADWGHAHHTEGTPEGPYGFDRASAEFDSMVQDIIKRGNLDEFLSADLDFADRAKVDGLWQAVMLAGALHHTPMRGELLSYEVPSYFGMLVAAYEC